MPFDGTGIYSRVHRWQDDRDNGIRILADRHDEEDDSIAGALNQAFLRSGVVPMTGPIVMNGNNLSQIGAGSALQPGLTFELDFDTGFFQPGAGQLAVSVSADTKMLWNDDGVQVFGDFSTTGSVGFSSLTPGSVLFAGIGGLLSQDNAKLFWDDTTNRLGIGTATPSAALEVVGGIKGLGLAVGVTFVENVSASIQSIADVTIIPSIAGGMGYLFNNYWQIDNFKAHAAGWSAGIAFNSSTGGLNINHSTASVAAGANAAMEAVAQFRNNGISLNKTVTVTGEVNATGVIQTPDAMKAATYYFKNNADAYIHAQGDGNMVLNADVGDYLYFNRSTNRWSLNIGSTTRFEATDGGAITTGTHEVWAPGAGIIKLIPGGPNNTGYVEFCNTAGTRYAYIGFQNTTAPGQAVEYNNASGGGHMFTGNILASGSVSPGNIPNFYLVGGDYCAINWDNGDAIQFWRSGNEMNFFNNGGIRTSIRANEQFFRTTTFAWDTNAYQCGATTHAWFNVSSYQYATPSDLREKIWRGPATDNEVQAAQALINELGFYKLKSGPVQDKLQFGLRAQHLARTLMDAGVVEQQNLEFADGEFIPEDERPVFDYNMIEFHSWERDELHGMDGVIEDVREPGNIFGVIPDQIALFMIYGLSKQIASLDARIKAFEDL